MEKEELKEKEDKNSDIENKENNTLYNFGIYHTQNDDDNLNSSLISYNYKKTF